MIRRLVLAGLLVATIALAQRGGRGGGGGGMGSGMPPGGIQKESKGQQINNKLKLSKEQAQQLEDGLNVIGKENANTISAVGKAKNDLANALLNGKKGAEVEPLVKALSDAEFGMMGVEVQAYRKLIEVLKPNQVSKAPEAFDLMAEIFVAPAAPAGGMRGGMGRGGR